MSAVSAIPETGLLTTRQAAEVLSISTRTIWTLSNSGHLPVIRIGGAVRYSLVDLREYIDRQRDSGKHKV
ncbi:MAG: helix-turn-helix domain-containing protein [Pirellulaceae bacterium]|nr:helix-turn-helix domain-containing protein [Pirellulaceae bacterium]